MNDESANRRKPYQIFGRENVTASERDDAKVKHCQSSVSALRKNKSLK